MPTPWNKDAAIDRSVAVVQRNLLSRGCRPQFIVMTLHFFTTGGTIDKIYFDQKSTYLVGETCLRRILNSGNCSLDYHIEEIFRKDSIDLTEADRAHIVDTVRRCPHERIIITHGTDTMTATGRLLQSVPGKTIVLTGSMQPARFAESDAVFNVGAAVMAAQTLPPGVYIAMHGQVFDPACACKNVAAHRFEHIYPKSSS